MKVSRYELSAAAIAILAPVTTSLATYTPSISNGPSYSVGIPPGSSISSSTAGSLYFSLSAPASYSWAALGIGRSMASSTIFIMFTDGNGNVTISARDGGGGHVEPKPDSTLMAGVTLLEGSGVLNGMMIANVHCTTCQLDCDATSASCPWIAAWNDDASPIASTDGSSSISQHGDDDYRQFTLDLTKAGVSSDSNPFFDSGSSTNGTGTASAPAASSTSTPGSDGDSDSSSQEIGTSESKINTYSEAHGIIMGLVVVLLFPLGSLLMRIPVNPWIHATLQLLSLTLMIAGLALGIKLAQFTDQLWGNTHTELGVAVVALFVLQPFLGLLHHWTFKREGGRTVVSHLHVWYGRALMVLAVVNGGLGLKLADNSRKGEIVYGVLAGVVGVLYVGVVVVRRKGGTGLGLRSAEKVRSPSS